MSARKIPPSLWAAYAGLSAAILSLSSLVPLPIVELSSTPFVIALGRPAALAAAVSGLLREVILIIRAGTIGPALALAFIGGDTLSWVGLLVLADWAARESDPKRLTALYSLFIAGSLMLTTLLSFLATYAALAAGRPDLLGPYFLDALDDPLIGGERLPAALAEFTSAMLQFAPIYFFAAFALTYPGVKLGVRVRRLLASIR